MNNQTKIERYLGLVENAEKGKRKIKENVEMINVFFVIYNMFY
jgi:hypothetical protein